MSAPLTPASASSRRLVWRPLRATSVMPFLWASNSSSTTMGRKMSCSSKRNRALGSCNSTLVSSTNRRDAPVARALMGARALATGRTGALGAAGTCSGNGAGARATTAGAARRMAGVGSAGLRAGSLGLGLGLALEGRRAANSMTSVDRRAPRLAGGGGRGMELQAGSTIGKGQRKSRREKPGGFCREVKAVNRLLHLGSLCMSGKRNPRWIRRPS